MTMERPEQLPGNPEPMQCYRCQLWFEYQQKLDVHIERGCEPPPQA